MSRDDWIAPAWRRLAAACFACALSQIQVVPAATARDDIGETIELCASCHGKAGVPADAAVPIIAGQEFYYLYVQLKDYKAGRRSHEIMSEIAKPLSKIQMQALAKYYSERTWPRVAFSAEDGDIAKAERAAAAGQCPQCHLGSYIGDSRIPRVAGQKASYLEGTMLAFKNKARLNAAAKGSLFAGYSDDDIRALANYLAGL